MLKDKQEIWDIEELVELGKYHSACPYYLSRDMMQKDSAELVFMPYNYLVDPQIRSSLGISLDNCVVIFDEAHNVVSEFLIPSIFNI